jgi:hypothetical protein
MPWRDVRRGWRNPQVLPSPRMPNALFGHLPAAQGKEMATGMAPPKREGNRWDAPLGYSYPTTLPTSRGYVSITPANDYRGVAEAARIYPMRSVTATSYR